LPDRWFLESALICLAEPRASLAQPTDELSFADLRQLRTVKAMLPALIVLWHVNWVFDTTLNVDTGHGSYQVNWSPELQGAEIQFF
jgi:hypothetical protein